MTKSRGIYRPTRIERFMDKVFPEPNSGCWLWLGYIAKDGYGRVTAADGTGIMLAHRSSFELFRQAIPPGLYVCHKCDTRACVNPDHLFAGTQRDNMRDCSRKGRCAIPNNPTGELHPRYTAKLAPDQVKEIWFLGHPRSLSNAEIARRYNISATTIWKIMNDQKWTHITQKLKLQ